MAAAPAAGWAQSPLDGFDPGANQRTRAVALQPDGKILVGGDFTMIGGGGTGTTSRERLARLNPDGSVDSSFNPGANLSVWVFALQADGKILVGGDFTMIGGGGTGSTPLERLARLNADGSVDTGFNPGADANVKAIAVQPDGKILVAGEFVTLGGGTRNHIGRLNADGSLDATFTADANGFVTTITLQPNGRILLSGPFGILNGVARTYIGRLNSDGSFDTSFNPPGPNHNIYAVAVQADGKILVGGQFTHLGADTRNYIGRLHADGALDSGFNPGADNAVEAIVVQADGKIIVGGWFFSQPSKRIARLNPDGAIDSGFHLPDGANDIVTDIAVQPDGKVLVAGTFTFLSSSGRNRIGRLLTDGRVETTFNPGTDASGTVYALAVRPDARIVVGGAFTTLAGVADPRLGQLRPDGTIDDSVVGPGYPGANDFVFTVAVQADNRVVVGGQFTALDIPREKILRTFPGTLNADPSFNPFGAVGTVSSFVLQPDGKILVGGGFVKLGGFDRFRVGRLNADGTYDASYPLQQINNAVSTIARQPDGRLVVGGNFTNIGFPREKIGRFTTQGMVDGVVDTTFNPGADGSVSAVAVQADGKILVGGLFGMIGGGGTGTTPRQRIARLNTDGSVDTTFNPGADGDVSAFAIQADGKIVVGGSFANLGGAARSRIGRLNADGTIDPTFNPGVFGQAHSLALQADGKILAGGPFTHLGGGTGTTPRLNIGRLTNTTAATQSLSASAGGAIITWLRGGSSPEVSRVTFEISTDGTNYTPLGDGTRIAGGWRLSGQSPPTKQNVYIRARGHYATGHRNGSESIVESVRNFFFGHSPFTDDELTAGLNVIRAVHITELRTRIEAVRAREGLQAFTYTNATLVPGSSVASAVDVAELRAALAEVYTTLGMTPPSYATTPAQGAIVRAADITTLRAATGAVE
jgi:uncharacterized delta-60 repeat protein